MVKLASICWQDKTGNIEIYNSVESHGGDECLDLDRN